MALPTTTDFNVDELERIYSEFWDVIAGGWIVFTLFAVVAWVIGLLITILIVRKAGFKWWWALVYMILPVVNIILFLIFLFMKWPVQKERDESNAMLRQHGLVPPGDKRRAEQEAKRSAKAAADAQKQAQHAQAQQAEAERRRDEMNAAAAAVPPPAPAAEPEPAPEDPPVVEPPADGDKPKK